MSHDALDLIRDSLTSDECLHLVLSKPRRAEMGEFTKVTVRPVVVQERGQWQFTFHFPNKVTHENLTSDAAAERAAELLLHTFEHAVLFTPAADYGLRAKPGGAFRVKKSPPSKERQSTGHNRTKTYLIPEGVPCPFLHAIGVMTAEGRVRAAMYHKFRQINRFLELVDDIVPDLPLDRMLRIVDFGCGKSYLTFALHHLLVNVHHRDVNIVGLDRKTDVIRDCAALAGRLECTGLEFREGDIQSHTADGPVDLAVSLHACDTATDDALAKAVAWECRVILAVPCCQHEFALLIHTDELSPLMRHGLLRDRFAALATDALRAQLLEIHGYATQIVEFIDMEHTPKNILIRAVRRASPDPHRDNRRDEYAAYKRLLGLDALYLERALKWNG